MNNENYKNIVQIGKKSMHKAIISIVLFLISIFLYYGFISELKASPNSLGIEIVFLLIPCIALLTASISLSILSIQSYNELKKFNCQISLSRRILKCINFGQFIIIFLIVILTLPYIMATSPASTTKKEFQKLYSDNSKIIGECQDSDGYFGGEDRYIIVFKYNMEGIYSYLKYIINTKEFFDATDGFMEAPEISLNEYFGDNYVSLIHEEYHSPDHYFYDKYISVIFDRSNFTDEQIKNIYKKLESDLKEKYGSVLLYVYSVSDFEKIKSESYKLYLISEMSDCDCLLKFVEKQISLDDIIYYHNGEAL